MTIRHLQIFVAVVETGTMREAGLRLYLSQPTISQAIKDLEEQGGVSLFERFGKRLHLTAAGAQLLAQARKVLSGFEQLEQAFAKGGFRETLRVGGTMTVGTCLMTPIMKAFQERHPEVDTYVFIGNTRTIDEKLMRSELDLALVEGTVTSPSLISVPMIDDYLVLACRHDHPLAQKREVRIAELEGQPFVMREIGSGTRDLFENVLRAHGVQIKIKWEAICPETIRSAIYNCGCLACISVRLLETDIREKRLHIITHAKHEWDRSFSLVYHHDKAFTPAMTFFKEIVATYKRPDFLDTTPYALLI